MSIELRVPEVGESISEVVIGDWLKQVGDWVERDEPIVVIETDKVTVELLAPERGTIEQILLTKGAPAKVRDLVGYLQAGTVAPRAATAEPKTSEPISVPPSAVAEPAPFHASLPTESVAALTRTAAATPVPPANVLATAEPTHWESPSARRARAEMQARVGVTDVQFPLADPVPRSATVPSPTSSGSEPHVAPATANTREEQAIAMSPFRRTVAERLVQSKNTAALLTTFNEVDLSSVQDLRKRYQDAFQKRHQIKLGLMSFFVKAVVEALKLVPVLNAEIRGTDIVYKNYFDIGVAVGGGRGLVVPVIRNAEYLGLAEIERTISDFGVRAKENRLQLEELTGGTFTISNGGVYGFMLSTPIINPPQSGILGLHAIQDRPVALEGQVVIRPMMYVALTYDHRIVDGREAVTFLRLIKEFVEQPARILLEV